MTSDLTELLDASDFDALNRVLNKVSEHLPEQYEINICVENGAAWVDLWHMKPGNNYRVELPDIGTTFRDSIRDELNNALCIANGWNI